MNRSLPALCLSLAVWLAGCGSGEESRRSGHTEPGPTGYIEANDGIRLHYRVMGTGTDTLVVVHGGPGAGMNSLLPVVEPLAEDRVLVLYDQRGGGRSTLPEDTADLSAEDFVRDLEAVRRHFGLDRMSVFAHSFGAVLVARYAMEHPTRLDRIVLHGATGPNRRQQLRRMREAAQEAGPRGDTALARRHRELMLTLLRGEAEDPVATCRSFYEVGRRLARSRGEEDRWPATTCDAPAEAVRYYYRYTSQVAPRSFGDWDFRGRLGEVRAPALVVWGARDSASVPLQRAWAEAYPNGRLLLVPEAGKGALADRPDHVGKMIETFLQGEWPPAAGSDTASGEPEPGV